MSTNNILYLKKCYKINIINAIVKRKLKIFKKNGKITRTRFVSLVVQLFIQHTHVKGRWDAFDCRKKEKGLCVRYLSISIY